MVVRRKKSYSAGHFKNMTETNSSATHGHRSIFLLRRYMNRATPFHSLLLTYCENI